MLSVTCKPFMLSIAVLSVKCKAFIRSVIKLSVVMLSVVMLSVVAPLVRPNLLLSVPAFI
jgi:hypothetical protein